jgi:hypothetical protein
MLLELTKQPLSIGVFMYALLLLSDLDYGAVNDSVPNFYTIRKLSHMIFSNL